MDAMYRQFYTIGCSIKMDRPSRNYCNYCTSKSRSNPINSRLLRDGGRYRPASGALTSPAAEDVVTSLGISSRDKSRMRCRRVCFEAGNSSSTAFINQQNERFISRTSKPRNQRNHCAPPRRLAQPRKARSTRRQLWRCL